MIYDLSADRIRFVEMDSGGFDRSAIFRIVTPRPGSQDMPAGLSAAPFVRAA